jgi:RND family efflux transporter MFP subunit
MMAQKTGAGLGQRPRAGRRPVVLFFVLVGLVVAAAIAGGFLPRLSRQKSLLAASERVAERKPVVIVTVAHLEASKDSIDLPGDLQAMIESPIFSRADGYLKSRMVDIGSHVKSGQLMAEIETPELDQQISQARATLAQAQSSQKELQADITLAKANLDLARVTSERWQRLLAKGVVPRQEADQRKADLEVKQAQVEHADASLATAQDTIRASQANLNRLEQLKAFARVTAPFDGVVTARNVDIGTLINAGTKEMFRVARIDLLRIFVQVPQTYVASIHEGQSAELRVDEQRGTVFPAKVTNISNSLDAGSRAMLVILQTPNPGGRLYPGMYAQVRFSARNSKPMLLISGEALQMSKSGPRVAVVGTDHVVHFRNVSIGQDLGAEVEIGGGLAPGDLVISNPSDAVQEGTVVEVRKR